MFLDMEMDPEHRFLTLNEQLEHYYNPHQFEGLLYDTPAGIMMFCQVGRKDFRFIDIKDGNRLFDLEPWSERGELYMKRFIESGGDDMCRGNIKCLGYIKDILAD